VVEEHGSSHQECFVPELGIEDTAMAMLHLEMDPLLESRDDRIVSTESHGAAYA
jgi:hypothetical protein